MIKILVTGAKGQLASCLKDMADSYEILHFNFVDASQLDITDKAAVTSLFRAHTYHYCVNCAAYTQVDVAETEKEAATLVNSEGPKNLAEACDISGTTLVHISTDFVFDGNKSEPYQEKDKTNPIGHYGYSKLLGEKSIATAMQHYFILRTSWLYSEFGHNFMKSMIRLGTERESLSIVYDQIGTPTYARDLVKVVLKIITTNNKQYGVYHYSNEGVASWYDFAKAIFEMKGMSTAVSPIRSEAYPTPAKRPAYSVFDKAVIKRNLDITIPHWRDSLKQAITKL